MESAREEMDRIWSDCALKMHDEQIEVLVDRVKVLEAKVAELDRVIVEVLHETNR